MPDTLFDKATPRPWHFREFLTDNIPALSNTGERSIMGEHTRIGTVDCQADYKRGQGHKSVCKERDANARLIVTAVNEFQNLVDELESARATLRQVYDRICSDAHHGELSASLLIETRAINAVLARVKESANA